MLPQTTTINKNICSRETSSFRTYSHSCEVVPFLDRNNPLSYENYGCYIYLSKSLDFINIDWCCQPTYQLANYQLATTNLPTTNLPTTNLPTCQLSCQLLVITIT